MKQNETQLDLPLTNVMVGMSDVDKYSPNPILKADSYKASQYLQYPPGTKMVSSYIEPRGGVYSHVVNFGIQMFIKEYLRVVPTRMEVARAARAAKFHGVPFNYEGWLQLSKLGYFPLEIEAIPEGTVVPVKNALVQVINTHPDFHWLVSYLETQMLRAVWYCSTVATLSANIRHKFSEYANLCGMDDFGLNFKLHNFGDRGATGDDSAMLAGMSHITSFFGTDCLASLEATEHYYDCDFEKFLLAVSIPASEHSTITSWGKENEFEAFRNMIEKNAGINDDGTPKMFACVSDSYNIWKALDMWKSLEPELLAKGGVLVIRPDSGCPIKTPQNVIKRCLELFGYSLVTGRDGIQYKVLPDHIRVIQGDGVNTDSISRICKDLITDGISIENIAFGMGGELVQKINRDTMKWAMKCSFIAGNNDSGPFETKVYKDPIGTSHPDDKPDGNNFKRSKCGRLAVVDINGIVQTIDTMDMKGDQENMLKVVFSDGIMYNPCTFSDVRERIANGRHLINRL